jgi:hypothetical protein
MSSKFCNFKVLCSFMVQFSNRVVLQSEYEFCSRYFKAALHELRDFLLVLSN